MKRKTPDALSIPNILSYIRILLVPLFVVLYMGAQTNLDYLWASLVLVLSGLTDLLDGYIARHYNMITSLGKVLDPAADKLTQATVAICLAIRIPEMCFLLIIFIAKEVIMLAASGLLLSNGGKINGARWFGKAATAVFYGVMVLIVLLPNLPHLAKLIMIGISAIMMIIAFIGYVPVFFTIIKDIKKKRHTKKEISEDK